MAKSKKNEAAEEPATLGDDEQAHPGLVHSHAPYLSEEDADIRLQRAQGDSRASTPQE
jgi:hypothetical protein